MKRLLALLTVITAFAFAPVIADANEGVFTVKQFNLKNKVDSISEALLAMNNQSSWQDEPVAGQYPIIAFYRNLDPNSLANFKSSMVPFPGTVSKPGCFVVKITGTINIPESGNWTFACGSDDGFKVTISGNGFSKRFAYPSARMSDTSLKTFSFPNAGEYVIHLVYFNKGMDSDLDYETNWGVYDHAELEFSMAKGSYSSFNSSAFSLVRASSGEEYHDIVFDANGGEGEMEAQVIVHGGKCTLSANAFFLNGYVFQGWATSTNGPVVYSDGAEITVDSDKTLYAVWNNPALKLEAESADWSSGSITLRCEDDATSASTPKYSLEYCNERGEWVAIDGAKNISATKGQNSAGQEVWIAKLTDTGFSSRLAGIPPVSYRVTDETGRVSEPCVTRTKYGIFVSPGGYAPGVDLDVFPSATPNYAETFGRLATGLGAFAKVHVLTGSGAVYSGIDGAFKDIAGKIKCGDVCFLYFGTHGGLQPNSTSSCLVLYDGTDYKENALATHIKLLNGLDASNPDGNGVAIVGFVHACHSKGISDNTGDEYCRVGSWCVNSVLTSKNSAWITATDDPKALSLGDYFSLFLLNYGWEKGWGGNSGEPLSCEQLADYTKKRTDALFDGLIMKGGSVSYSSKVGVFGASAMLRNIMIGKCGNHDSTGIPSDPEEISAQGINTSTIQVQAKSILNADRTLLFKRRGEDAGWEAPCYWQGGAVTFSYDDTDVASSGRELPYYYQIRTLNGAGIGKSTVASAWRIHTESHKVTFMYELPQTVQSPSAGIWWELPYDSTLSEIWNNLEKSVADLGVNGFVHTGWFTEPHGRGSRITRDTRVFKPVTYYAAWTAMTQGWLDSHPATASAANGDIATAATMTAANGCRTVGECYALGINPEDPTDDLRIAQFELQNGKPQLTLNHTADGSGKTFLPDVRVLGTTTLGESPQWDDVTDIANPDAAGYRFFKATVELP